MALVEKTSVKPGEALIAKFPPGRGASIEIAFANSQTLREIVEVPEGDAERPLSRSSLERKFMNFAVPVVGKAGAERVISLVDGLEELKDVQELTQPQGGWKAKFGMNLNNGVTSGTINLSMESHMNRFFVAVGLGFVLSGAAFAQQKSAKNEIVGAWSLVSVASEMDDGKKGEPFGPSPKGVVIFSNDGHFSLFQSRAEIPKIAANDRAKATPEEAENIVASSIAYYGTYSIDENTKVMSVNIDASTYANVAAVPNQKRTITLLTSDELKFDNSRTPNGMTLRTTWKRSGVIDDFHLIRPLARPFA